MYKRQPLLEAMTLGVPSIASSSTSVGEVMGEAEYCFDPEDVSAIRDKLDRALHDDEWRDQLSLSTPGYALQISHGIKLRSLPCLLSGKDLTANPEMHLVLPARGRLRARKLPRPLWLVARESRLEPKNLN